MNKQLLTFIFLILISFSVIAQQEMSLHLMKEVQQVTFTNPAILPEEKTNINFFLPLPTYAFNIATTGPDYNDMFVKNNQDSIEFSMDNAIPKMGSQNYIYIHAQIDYLKLHFRFNKLALGIHAAEKIDFNVRYPRQLINFLWNGNAQFEGETINLALGSNINYYREFGLTGAYEHSYFTFGATFKYLNGLMNIYTEKADVNFTTDEDVYFLTVQTDYRINTSGVDSFPGDAVNDFLLNTNNPGFGADLGVTFNYTDKLSFAASMHDIAFINWNTFVRNFHSEGEFSYDGIHLNDYFETDTLTFGALGDSLVEELQFEKSSEKYRTWLIPKLFLSGTYTLDSVNTFGAVFYGEFFEGINPSLLLSYRRKFGKILHAGIVYGYKNRSFANLGLNATLNAGPFQMFIVSDNLWPFFMNKAGIPLNDEGQFPENILIPKNAKNFNFRFGINWAFGKPDPKPKITMKKQFSDIKEE